MASALATGVDSPRFALVFRVIASVGSAGADDRFILLSRLRLSTAMATMRAPGPSPHLSYAADRARPTRSLFPAHPEFEQSLDPAVMVSPQPGLFFLAERFF